MKFSYLNTLNQFNDPHNILYHPHHEYDHVSSNVDLFLQDISHAPNIQSAQSST